MKIFEFMKLFKIIFFVFLLAIAQACSTNTDKFELRSPCVSLESGSEKNPCDKRPANGWINQVS